MKKKYILALFLILGIFAIYLKFFNVVGKGTIPVITYHAFTEETTTENEYVLPIGEFENMVKALSENGFTFLSINDVIDIIYNEKPLPNNPILITMDDGYEDNWTLVGPVLKKYNARATVFLIGSMIDGEGYLSWDQVQQMAESGDYDLENHSFNSHAIYTEGPNEGKTHMSAPSEGESEEDYYERIKKDIIWNNNLIYNRSSVFPTAIAYPGAMSTPTLERAAKDSGLKIGFIGAEKTASKVKDLDPFAIKRFHIKPGIKIDRMVRFLKSNNEV